jgi:DNA-binding NarL/FixJ family response regulator
MKLLLVDDDVVVLDELRAFLSRVGHDVACSASVPEAEAALATQTFDLLVLDVRMGSASIVDWLAETGWALRTPTLLLSGSADVEEVVRGLVAGAIDFVHKFDPPEALAVAIESAAEGSTRWSQAPAVVPDAELAIVGDLELPDVVEALLGGELRYVAEIAQDDAIHTLFEVAEPKAPLPSKARLALELVGRGWSSKQIAFELEMTPSTLSVIVEAARRALGFQNGRQLRRLLAAVLRS